MTPTGLTLQYQDANNATQTVALEAAGALEGGSVTGLPRFTFRSHGESECTIRFPGVSPDVAPQIPFESKVIIKRNGSPIFQGRRINRSGQADVHQPYVEYTFQDAFYDLAHLTFKQTWFSCAYQPATLSGSRLTFENELGQWFSYTTPGEFAAGGVLYDSNQTRIGTFTGMTAIDSTTATIVGVVCAGVVGSVTLLNNYPDTVLFQYIWDDPYQTASQINQFYITTGSQLVEILNFSIAAGVDLQFNTTEIETSCSFYVPWYPVRSAKCSDAIAICLRMHPDCFTEIDYTTTPPTFHVRKRKDLTQISLPYETTDTNNRRHVATNITPRPELVPKRIGIFYRYLMNGNAIMFPQDIYPVNESDGLRAFDYSLDLQGPRFSTTSHDLTSKAFNRNDINWWLTKCGSLRAKEIPIQGNADGVQFDSSKPIEVVDDNDVDINTNTYGWELLSGSVDFWYSGVHTVDATAKGYFKYKIKDANGNPIWTPKSHLQTARVKLVNSASKTFIFTQYLTNGEAIPQGLAQSVYESLQSLQYNLNHVIFENPWGGSFIKPGKHGVNLLGGSTDWETMNATVQETQYTLHADTNGNIFADCTVRCGPVQHLEPGQLVQLFNMFVNRDLVKIDPWERITGIASPNSTSQGIGNTAKESTNPGLPDASQHSLTGEVADANEHFTKINLQA